MPRSAALLIGASVIVVVLGVIVYFTWRSIDEGRSIKTWTYSQLLTEAQAGHVVTLVIDGQTGMATDPPAPGTSSLSRLTPTRWPRR